MGSTTVALRCRGSTDADKHVSPQLCKIVLSVVPKKFVSLSKDSDWMLKP